MRIHLPPLILLLVLAWPLFGYAQDDSPALSPRIANYEIDVRLDPRSRQLESKQILRWRNTSNDIIRSIPFHLYLNAFKNNQSTFMKESGQGSSIRDGDWGWMEIDRLEDDNGNDLLTTMQYVHPDDDNTADQTVAEVQLAEPILPGATARFEIDFRAKLPRIVARTGYSKDYYLVGQWFPKIGVYETPGMRYADRGQWNCHQFHARSEFYADFGNYDVRIQVPSDYIVGASGSLERVDEKDGYKTHHYRVNDVVDFAWTAYPDFLVREDQWKEVSIRLLIPPEHLMLSERYLLSIRQSLEYFEKYLGPYPYNTLTVVDPPLHGVASSGMEYPTFITGLGLHKMPEGLRMVEIVSVHEFGHQYFMQLLASNEFEEPWLDEGFNTYFECRIMDQYYGEKTSFLDFGGFHFGDGENQRLSYTLMGNPKIAENFRSAWEFRHGGYGSLTYAKASTWLHTLEGLLGRPTMDEIMKTYFQRWKFQHPCARDFIDIVNEITHKNHGDKFGPDMHWFFDQVLYGSNVCDYQIRSIYNRKNKESKGIFGSPDEANTSAPMDSLQEEYYSRVLLYRRGEVILPQEVLIHFSNGEEKLEYWDGKDRTKEFSYNGPNTIVWAKLDPDNKIQIDLNLNDNSYTTQPKKSAVQKYAGKFMLWLQNCMQSISFLI
ncbi:MAG: M1 family metallopeptidase [Bacteroidota bacterium]